MTGEEYGIDELARRAGTTVRNVRLYVERGLLPHPRREGRTARYGTRHLARLELILRLIGRGYTLAAIRELTEAWDSRRGLGHVLGLEEAVTAPFETDEPRHYSEDELAARFPDDRFEENMARAVEIGLVVPDGDEYLAPTPTFLEVGAELAETGLPVSAVLDLAAATRRAAADLADAFVSAFVEHIWQPYEDAGYPDDQTERVVDAVNRQRPLANRVVQAALARAMQDRVDAAFVSEANTGASDAPAGEVKTA